VVLNSYLTPLAAIANNPEAGQCYDATRPMKALTESDSAAMHDRRPGGRYLRRDNSYCHLPRPPNTKEPVHD
jgi:hypothetical protein